MNNSLRLCLPVFFLPLQAIAAEDVLVPPPPAPVASSATAAPAQDPELAEIVVQAPEPRYVAPTNRDRIGRVWVPVYINEQGPFRLVLDSGATRSALTPKVASRLGLPLDKSPPVMLRGVTGSAVAPTVRVDSISVGDLY
ncbi:MAG TPA: retropepsin-like aspartic protease, partial [Steroidobacteraceae bacterium]|nr:retropepsin-like aspartic protease [Steroidobacteraceae bacterium]